MFGVSKWQIGVPNLGDVAWSPAVPDSDGTARTVVDLDREHLAGSLDSVKEWDAVEFVVHRPATGLGFAWRDPRLDFKIAKCSLGLRVPGVLPTLPTARPDFWNSGTGIWNRSLA